MIARRKTRTSDGDSKQIDGGVRKDRVSLSSKADVLFRRLDEPLVNVLQGGLQEQKKPAGRHGRESRRIWWRGGRRHRQPRKPRGAGG